MSAIGPSDARFHYSDNSHRWVPPDPSIDDEAWRAQVAQHMEAHRQGLGYERAPRSCGIPQQRSR